MSDLHILVVDDEPFIRELAEIALARDPDFKVTSCASGSEALAVADKWAPDVILLDVMMPVMDGPQTLKHLREKDRTAKTPVVFFTARAQASDLARFRSLGADGIIPKPFDPMTLAAEVKRYAYSSTDGVQHQARSE